VYTGRKKWREKNESTTGICGLKNESLGVSENKTPFEEENNQTMVYKGN